MLYKMKPCRKSEKFGLGVPGLEARLGIGAGLAQLVEQLFCKQQVIGSSPVSSSISILSGIDAVVTGAVTRTATRAVA